MSAIALSDQEGLSPLKQTRVGPHPLSPLGGCLKMGPMTSDFLRLEGELEKGELRPFYLLVGQDDYLRRRAEGMIVEAALEPPERGLNLTVLSATEASAEEVAESVRVLPFMAKRRVVVVREAERFLTERALPEALQRYAEGPNPQGVLILSASGRCWPRRGQKEWLYDLTPSGRGEVLYWIRRFAAEKGMKISPGALARLWGFTQGIPFYVQFIGRELSRRGERAVIEEEVERAVEEFLREEGTILFQEQWRRLSPKERKILQAMAKGLSVPSDIAREAGEPPNTVSQYLRYLAEKELVTRVEPGHWRIADQVFARWLRDKLE